LPHVAEYETCDAVVTRSEAIADVSLPVIRARSSPGTAIAAMMLMMATTISNSISVKPCSDRSVMFPALLLVRVASPGIPAVTIVTPPCVVHKSNAGASPAASHVAPNHLQTKYFDLPQRA
jgi:hypothetical protein